jgi:hypothetical protein
MLLGILFTVAVFAGLSTGLSAEWAWATVAHIVANKGGAFHS